MELQALLVLGGIGVAGAAVLLLMGLFSASGTSYEEAVAQQRRATTELLALAENKGKPKKNAKKASKKQAKKERSREHASSVTGSDPESETLAESGVEEDAPVSKPHVEFSAPVVVDVPRDTPAKEKKEEVEKKDAKVAKSGKGKQAVKPVAPEPVKEEVPAPVKEQKTAEPPKEQRKGKKSDKKQSDEVDAPRDEVVPPLNVPQPSELTTEKLLKQVAAPVPVKQASPVPAVATPPGKKKKNKEQNVLALIAAESGGVNVNELVRVVREAALSRNEIQILTDVLLNKQHDQLPQHSEWSEGPNDPMQKLKKQLAEKEKALADEVEASQALHAKLKELRTSLNSERSRATAAARAAEESAAEVHTLQARLQRSADDNHALAQEKMMLQSKLAAEGDAQAQRVQMEMHIQRLTETEGTLLAQMGALQADAAAHAHDAAIAQQHTQDLLQQLQEANRICGELDVARQAAIHSDQAAQQEIRQLQERLGEMQNEIQRSVSRAQVAEANAEKLKEEAAKVKEENEKVKQESEKQKHQLSNEMKSLREQLAAKETELAEVKQLKATAVAPAQNGLPSEKSVELSKVEGVIASLRTELAEAQHSSKEQKDQIATLKEQLKQYQDKNNEAVSKAQQTQYSEVAAVLTAACPSVAPKSAPSRAWLEAFADKLKQELAKQELAKKELAQKERKPSSDDGDLKAQNQHLQSLVDKYKTIIDDTEGVLSRLQMNVTAEEERWAKQLADKQEELDDLRQRTITQMQSKIDSLQADLEKAGSNHNHSFADAERHTEERLMHELSSKHKPDSLNGPLQV